MLCFATAVTLSLINLVYAAFIYLPLRGWIVVHEPSGMQLIMHLFVTGPIVLITTVWFFYLSKQKKRSTIFWQINLLGILIPIMSIQTGVTYYHFDIIGLIISALVATSIFTLFIMALRRHVNSKKGTQSGTHCGTL